MRISASDQHPLLHLSWQSIHVTCNVMCIHGTPQGLWNKLAGVCTDREMVRLWTWASCSWASSGALAATSTCTQMRSLLDQVAYAPRKVSANLRRTSWQPSYAYKTSAPSGDQLSCTWWTAFVSCIRVDAQLHHKATCTHMPIFISDPKAACVVCLSVLRPAELIIYIIAFFQ